MLCSYILTNAGVQTDRQRASRWKMQDMKMRDIKVQDTKLPDHISMRQKTNRCSVVGTPCTAAVH